MAATAPEDRVAGPFVDRTDSGRLAVTQSFSGPLPPPAVLLGYDEIAPGSARGFIDAHLEGEHAMASTMNRLSGAEAFSIRFGVIAAFSLAMGGLIAAVGFVVAGMPDASIAALIPAIVGSAAQMVAVKRIQK